MSNKKQSSGCRRYILAALIALLMTLLLAAGLTFLPRLLGLSFPFPVSFAQTIIRDTPKADKTGNRSWQDKQGRQARSPGSKNHPYSRHHKPEMGTNPQRCEL